MHINEQINNTVLVDGQNKEGLKQVIRKKSANTNRGIITKDVLIPVKTEDGKQVFDENGKPVTQFVTIPTYIPEVEKEAIKVFLDTYPCWFQGCEDIRKAYKQELEELSKTPGGCTGCKKGPLLRKYINKVVNILEQTKAYSTP